MGKIISFYENDIDKAWYNSSNVIYSECLDKEGELKIVKIVFKNGSTYQYKDVSVTDYLMFREDASQGKAINKFIKKYNFEKLENSDLNLIENEKQLLFERMEKELNKKAVIISAFPGCGKTETTYKLKNDYKILDLDSSNFDKKDFPKNYISTILENIDKYDIIFVSTHDKVRSELYKNNIEYFLFYPSLERKEEMIDLYKNRGNDGTFIDLMRNHYQHFLTSIIDDNKANVKVCLEYEGDFIINNTVFQEIIKNIKK
jgi:hypothetical protein